jgi:hypothetical protein
MDEEEKLVYGWKNEDFNILETLNNIQASVASIEYHEPILSCCSSMKEEPNIVVLKADYKESKYLVEKNPEQMDKLIKEELALRLARKMIDEDLISVYQGYDLDYETINFRATVKIVQE